MPTVDRLALIELSPRWYPDNLAHFPKLMCSFFPKALSFRSRLSHVLIFTKVEASTKPGVNQGRRTK
jgi:hypothetical protein